MKDVDRRHKQQERHHSISRTGRERSASQPSNEYASDYRTDCFHASVLPRLVLGVTEQPSEIGRTERFVRPLRRFCGAKTLHRHFRKPTTDPVRRNDGKQRLSGKSAQEVCGLHKKPTAKPGLCAKASGSALPIKSVFGWFMGRLIINGE